MMVKNYSKFLNGVYIPFRVSTPKSPIANYTVAVNRAKRWEHLHIYDNQIQKSSVDFLNRVVEKYPVTIQKVLTDNSTQFADFFTVKEKQPLRNQVVV